MNLSTSFGTWEAGPRRETKTSRGAGGGGGGGALAASTIPVIAMFNSMAKCFLSLSLTLFLKFDSKVSGFC